MPKISLVVCLYKERDFLERLLAAARDCYDDLVVVHDGPEDCCNAGSARDAGGDKEAGWKSPEELSLVTPDAPPKAIARDYAQLASESPLPTGYRHVEGPAIPGGIYELVDRYGGRFYEGPRCFQQEPHWPFAWWAAQNDWILRLDADEFPSPELKKWLIQFRMKPQPERASGFICIWPPWDGHRTLYRNAFPCRHFLFNKKRVHMFGMVEQTPVGDSPYEPLDLVLEHKPSRKSYGVRNLLFRRQAYRWRTVIAASLAASPSDLPCWCWGGRGWPQYWGQILRAPLLTGLNRFVQSIPREFLDSMRLEFAFLPDAALGTALHKLLVPLTFWGRSRSSK